MWKDWTFTWNWNQVFQRKRKKWSKRRWSFKERTENGEESKTSFPIFKSAKDVESKTLQNNQLKSNENQNHWEKTVELSSESDIQKTATHPYDNATYRAKSLEGLKNFQKRKLIDRVYVPPKNYQFSVRIISGSRRKFNSTWLQEFSWSAYSPSSDGCFVRFVLCLVIK